jgi:hypothetical protein
VSQKTQKAEKMSESHKTSEAPAPFAFVADQQKAAAGFIGPVFSSGIGPLLKVQSDLLEAFGAASTAWFHRRHAAVADARRLTASLRDVSGPADILRVQQEWTAGVFRSITDEVTGYQATAQKVLAITQAWFPQVAESAQDVASQAAAVTRAAGKQLREAAKHDEPTLVERGVSY